MPNKKQKIQAMNFAELKSFLMQADYTDKEFREIRAIAEIRLGNFSSREAALKEVGNVGEEYVTLFYSQLRNYLESDCGIATPPLSILRKSKPGVYRAIVLATNFLYGVSEDWNKDRIVQRNFVVGVYYLYAKLVVQYLREVRVPVSVKTILQHTDKFIGLVDNSYPGYVTGGLIKMVILGPSKENSSRPQI